MAHVFCWCGHGLAEWVNTLLQEWGPSVCCPWVSQSMALWVQCSLPLHPAWSLVKLLTGQWLSVSMSCICAPGQYLMVTSYLCSSNNILWRWGGALARFFMAIISNSLWSLSTVKLLPSRYVLKHWQAKMIAKSSLSVLAYRVSTVHKALAGKGYGLVLSVVLLYETCSQSSERSVCLHCH